MIADRFKLEEKIMRAWSTSDDIEDFITKFYDSPQRMTNDEVFNIVWGIKELHDLRMESVLEVFKQVFCLDEYAKWRNVCNPREGECND